jgi:hypothetical protein
VVYAYTVNGLGLSSVLIEMGDCTEGVLFTETKVGACARRHKRKKVPKPDPYASSFSPCQTAGVRVRLPLAAR